MIHFDKQQLARTAREKGFVRDTYEKVLRLASVLRDFSEDEILSQHLVLKGGTAINLMFVNVPRLSVDIDLDVIADVMGDELQELRKVLTQRITSLMGKEGYLLSESSRFSFSLDSFLFDYVNAGGNRDHLKVELNYSLRSHLFEPRLMELNEITMQNSLRVLTLDPMEIYAAKANALMSRAAARDLYDFSYMVERNPFDRQENLFRKSIVFYSMPVS